MVLLKKSNELLIFQYLAVSLVIFGLLVRFYSSKMGICSRLRFLKCYIFIICLWCLRFDFRGQSASLECDCIWLWKKLCLRLANFLLVCCCTTSRSVQTSEIILFTRKQEVEKHANNFTASLNLLLLQQVYSLISLLCLNV